MKQALPAKDLDKVLKLVGDLIERLRASLTAMSGAGDTKVKYLFISTWGGLSLSGDDADAYRACRDAIIRLHGANTERRLISRRTVEKLLTDTLLRALRPVRSGYKDPRPRFEGRKARELRRLRRRLSAGGRSWQLAVEVTGLWKTALPMMFGRVSFIRGSRRAAKQITSNLHDLQPGDRRTTMKKRFAENESRKKLRGELTSMFESNAIALVGVAAADGDAAKELGLGEVRRAVDILNFFAKCFEHPAGTHRAYLAPEGPGACQRWAVYDPDTWMCAPPNDTPDEWPITKVRPQSRLARQVGLARVHELLARETRSDLEDRIITAAAWAGRARTERRREEAFLLYVVALEALLAKPKARSGVTDRLRLRVAHLVHRKPASRRVLAKTMERLYELRSALVHAGDAEDLADEDLKIIDWVVEAAILTILTRAPFKNMKDAAAFERWFDDRLLGAS